MEISGLCMYPFSTTLLGVVKGVLDHYCAVCTDAGAFGATGHAFLVNIHEDLCPSAPYCWDTTGFRRLLRNLGVEMEELGFFTAGDGGGGRADLEREVRTRLDRGEPCSLCNMEHQLIAGYDEEGFVCLQPWPACPDFPPRRLTYGTWAELGEELHAGFFAFRRCDPRPGAVVPEAIAEALEMHANPSRYSSAPYSAGLGAYDSWRAAVAAGRAHPHGSWWCSSVWSECRRMASSWMSEIACSLGPGRAEGAARLSEVYSMVSGRILLAGLKTIDRDRKLSLLGEARELEEEAAGILGTLV